MKRTALLAAVMLALAGCMEVEQSAGPTKQGRYQGKPDTPPWSNEPLATGPKWTKGNEASWEEEIKKRQLVQHEDRRIYQ